MDSRELQLPEREKLKAMLKTLFPEYPTVAVGTEFVSFTTDRQPDLETTWVKIHWVPLLMGEVIRRLSLLGKKDKEWVKNIVSHIVYSFIYPQSTHPVSVIYDSYLSIFIGFKAQLRDKKDTGQEDPKELLQKV